MYFLYSYICDSDTCTPFVLDIFDRKINYTKYYLITIIYYYSLTGSNQSILMSFWHEPMKYPIKHVEIVPYESQIYQKFIYGIKQPGERIIILFLSWIVKSKSCIAMI